MLLNAIITIQSQNLKPNKYILVATTFFYQVNILQYFTSSIRQGQWRFHFHSRTFSNQVSICNYCNVTKLKQPRNIKLLDWNLKFSFSFAHLQEVTHHSTEEWVTKANVRFVSSYPIRYQIKSILLQRPPLTRMCHTNTQNNTHVLMQINIFQDFDGQMIISKHGMNSKQGNQAEISQHLVQGRLPKVSSNRFSVLSSEISLTK